MLYRPTLSIDQSGQTDVCVSCRYNAKRRHWKRTKLKLWSDHRWFVVTIEFFTESVNCE